MMTLLKKRGTFALCLMLFLTAFMLWGCGPQSGTASAAKETTAQAAQSQSVSVASEAVKTEIREDGAYTAKDEVALYLHTFGKLPDNYITKKEAENLGWDSREGNLWEVAPGKSIGGSHYGNYEKALPEAKGRKYFECDINYDGGYRGSERIIYSNDGLIYYTGDHYKTFTLLYEQEG